MRAGFWSFSPVDVYPLLILRSTCGEAYAGEAGAREPPVPVRRRDEAQGRAERDRRRRLGHFRPKRRSIAFLVSGGRDCHTRKPVEAILVPSPANWSRRRLGRLLVLSAVLAASSDCLERGAPAGLQPGDVGLLRFRASARLRFL
jgi:hypothetical protein